MKTTNQIKNSLKLTSIYEILGKYKLILCDIWGVILEAEENYLGVNEFIKYIQNETDKELLFVTNSPRPAIFLEKLLSSRGFQNITKDMLITSGDIARSQIKEIANKQNIKTPNILHIGEEENHNILDNFPCNIISDINNINKADLILLSLYRDEQQDNKEIINQMKLIAKSNLPVICSNPDIIVPKHGQIRYCAGYFAAIIEKLGKKVIYSGKPKNIIFDKAMSKFPNIKKEQIIMIGDSLETDILGAYMSEIDSAITLSGNCNHLHHMHDDIKDKIRAIENACNEKKLQPKYIIDNLDHNYST